jgi:hypothetical protein
VLMAKVGQTGVATSRYPAWPSEASDLYGTLRADSMMAREVMPLTSEAEYTTASDRPMSGARNPLGGHGVNEAFVGQFTIYAG